MLFEDGIYTALLKGGFQKGIGEHGLSSLVDLWKNKAGNVRLSAGITNYNHIFKELVKNPLYGITPLMAIMGLQNLYNHNQSLKQPSNFIIEASLHAFDKMLNNPLKTGLLASGIASILYLKYYAADTEKTF